MIENYNSENTNQAWNLLHSRLEEEGLLTEANPNRKALFRSSVFRWAAATIILCIGFGIAIMVMNDGRSEKKLLSIYNPENAPTLVTTLEDGSIVYLANEATLHFPKHFEDHRREVFLKGDALFDVSGNKKRPFVIETDQFMIEVLGTMFNVRSRNDRAFSLSVEHGEVKIRSKQNDKTVFVKAGETALFQNGQLNKIFTEDVHQFLNYRKQIQFKDEPLSDIIRVINRNSADIQLEISPALEERLLTVTFSDDSPVIMAQLICMALNLQCVQQQDKIYISESK